jgi:hypothetical protein
MAAGMARQGEMQTRLEAIEVGIDQKLDRLEAFHGQQLAISREICASLAHDEPARARCYQAVLK